jgi:hypothetical protein
MTQETSTDNVANLNSLTIQTKEVVARARFAGQLRCLALAKLRFAANARLPASEAVPFATRCL